MRKLLHMLNVLLFITTLLFASITIAATSSDPLPSWNDGAAKSAILHFIHVTTDKSNAEFISPEQRLAVFDQDGTLWVEQPVYTQVAFGLERIIALAPQHPEWKNQEPFKSLIARDKDAIAKFTMQDLEKIMMTTHTGITVEAFNQIVKDWLVNAKNPRWHRPYTDLIYQPMLEVMNLFRKNGYKTYIVTGGGQDFVRVYADRVYHVPSEQIIGSALKTRYKNGMLTKEPTLLLNNDLAGKPEDIYLFTGRIPQAAFGNSVGDQQMLEYTQTSKGASLLMLISHDDADREYAYGASSKIGTFPDALKAEAIQRKWQIVSMKNDWKRIFPFDTAH